LRPMARWQVYVGDEFDRSFYSGVEAFQFVWGRMEKEMENVGKDYFYMLDKGAHYNLRLDGVVVWEEEDDYESRRGVLR